MDEITVDPVLVIQCLLAIVSVIYVIILIGWVVVLVLIAKALK